jgi:hypothetical protein
MMYGPVHVKGTIASPDDVLAVHVPLIHSRHVTVKLYDHHLVVELYP